MDLPVSGFNVFLLNDNLSDFLPFFELKTGYFNLHTCSLEEFSGVLANAFNRNLRENNLVILHQSLLSEEVYTHLCGGFQKYFEFGDPYMVMLGKAKPKESYIRDTFGEGHRFYLLPNSKVNDHETYSNNLINFLILLFQRLEIDTRLNEYIIDSFKNMVDNELVARQKREIETLNSELKIMSKTDFLTRVLNRRAFFEALDREKKRTIRDRWRITKTRNIEDNKDKTYNDVFESEPIGEFLDHYGKFSLMMIDIDFFKKINDEHGHLTGDHVLRTLGQLLNSQNIFRENDSVARYGGEEFSVLLPETSYQNAIIPATRLSEELKQIVFRDENGKNFSITISIGISEFKMTDTSNDDIIKRADEALYYAKEHGRDTIVIYEKQFEGA